MKKELLTLFYVISFTTVNARTRCALRPAPSTHPSPVSPPDRFAPRPSTCQKCVAVRHASDLEVEQRPRNHLVPWRTRLEWRDGTGRRVRTRSRVWNKLRTASTLGSHVDPHCTGDCRKLSESEKLFRQFSDSNLPNCFKPPKVVLNEPDETTPESTAFDGSESRIGLRKALSAVMRFKSPIIAANGTVSSPRTALFRLSTPTSSVWSVLIWLFINLSLLMWRKNLTFPFWDVLQEFDGSHPFDL